MIPFSRSGYVAESRSVTLAGGKDARLDVQMSSGMRVTGVVVTEGGAPVADAAVTANSASEVGGRTVRSDANGGFQIEALGPGFEFLEGRSGWSFVCRAGPGRVLEPEQLMLEIAPRQRIESQRLLGRQPIVRLP